jgi:ribosomal protein L3 glutamine methyltransferase
MGTPSGTPSDQATEQLVTVADFIRWGATRFASAGLHFGHGTDNAADESLLLVAHALHLDTPMPPEFFQARLTSSERALVCDLIERRVRDRRPAAYLTGEASFAGMSFLVDERVLVPRSPIAEMIEERFAPWIDPDRVARILDLCAGSGCIGIACAAYFPDARVDLTDVSDEALAVAAANIDRHAVGDRVRAVKSDVFGALSGQRYDIIVSNPPYVPRVEYDSLPAEFGHEPSVGLLAGDRGLQIVRRILGGAADHLEPGGLLVVEVGNTEEAVCRAWPDLPLTWVEFSRGGAGVFLLTREQLLDAADCLE